jgi:hypothetical protein
MTDTVNPLAPHDLPWFITAPGGTDGLMVAMGIFLVVVVVAIGNLYFQLHALPERWAHKRSPIQVQIVAILALLALFTHNHIFWIAALLLALVQFPDFATPMYSMAESLRGLAGRRRVAEADAAESPVAPPDPSPYAAMRERLLDDEREVAAVAVVETVAEAPAAAGQGKGGDHA